MNVQFRFDYANLPFAENGGHPDFNRINWRCELLLTRNRKALEGMRILDLACNNGWLSYPCLELGAASVTGVEARHELIDKGVTYLEQLGVADRMTWVRADIFEYLESLPPGRFDVILCLGFLYHTVRQVDFFREMARLRPRMIIIDTSVTKNYFWFTRSGFSRPPCLRLSVEDASLTRNTLDTDGLILSPSVSFLEHMFRLAGYDLEKIGFDRSTVRDWAGMDDYRRSGRVAYLARPIYRGASSSRRSPADPGRALSVSALE